MEGFRVFFPGVSGFRDFGGPGGLGSVVGIVGSSGVRLEHSGVPELLFTNGELTISG